MITCYLDTQDYSVLTDSRTLSTELEKTRSDLLTFAVERRVKFLFSAAAICESAPTSPDASALAESRADFLVALCGSNALISFDRMFALELSALQMRTFSSSHVVDTNGDWFPNLTNMMEVIPSSQSLREIVEQEFRESGLSRKERRAKARAAVKNGKLRGNFKQHFDQQESRVVANKFIEQYPMKVEFADVIVSYFLGRATESEFREALLSSLRDPRYMMRWFAKSFSLSSPISEIVRSPGREISERLRQLALLFSQRACLIAEKSVDSHPIGKHGELSKEWKNMISAQLVSLVSRAAFEQKKEIGDFDSDLIDQFCPGISTTIRSLLSSVWMNIAGGRKEVISDSQPVDALHAMYAPYVNVFRADRFMAPHIQAQTKRHGTIVVSSLSQLVSTLENELRKSAPKKN